MFKDYLKRAREERALSLEVAALHIGVTEDMLLSWEAGGELPKIDHIQMIALSYHLNIKDLLLQLTRQLESNTGKTSSQSVDPFPKFLFGKKGRELISRLKFTKSMQMMFMLLAGFYFESIEKAIDRSKQDQRIKQKELQKFMSNLSVITPLFDTSDTSAFDVSQQLIKILPDADFDLVYLYLSDAPADKLFDLTDMPPELMARWISRHMFNCEIMFHLISELDNLSKDRPLVFSCQENNEWSLNQMAFCYVDPDRRPHDFKNGEREYSNELINKRTNSCYIINPEAKSMIPYMPFDAQKYAITDASFSVDGRLNFGIIERAHFDYLIEKTCMMVEFDKINEKGVYEFRNNEHFGSKIQISAMSSNAGVSYRGGLFIVCADTLLDKAVFIGLINRTDKDTTALFETSPREQYDMLIAMLSSFDYVPDDDFNERYIRTHQSSCDNPNPDPYKSQHIMGKYFRELSVSQPGQLFKDWCVKYAGLLHE